MKQGKESNIISLKDEFNRFSFGGKLILQTIEVGRITSRVFENEPFKHLVFLSLLCLSIPLSPLPGDKLVLLGIWGMMTNKENRKEGMRQIKRSVKGHIDRRRYQDYIKETPKGLRLRKWALAKACARAIRQDFKKTYRQFKNRKNVP